MALVLRRNPAPLSGALFVSNPKKRKKKKVRAKRKNASASTASRKNAAKKAAATRRKNALAKKRKNALAAKKAAATRRKNALAKTRKNALAKKRKNALAKKRKNGTKKGMARKSARKAYLGLKKRKNALAKKRKNGTKRGMARKTARKAYMKKRKPSVRRIYKNPMQIAELSGVEKFAGKTPILKQVKDAIQPALLAMVGGYGVYWGGKYIGGAYSNLMTKIPVVGGFLGKFGYTVTGLIGYAVVQFLPMKPAHKKALGMSMAVAGGAINAYKLASGTADDYNELDDYDGLAEDLDGLAEDLDGLGLTEEDLGDGMFYEVEPISAGGYQGLGIEDMAGTHDMSGSHYHDANLGDAMYSGDDLSVEEGEAAIHGAHAYMGTFGAPPHIRYRRHHRYSHLAGRRGHRWGWMIKLIGWPRFAKLAAMNPAQRIALIAQLRQAAAQAAQAKFDESQSSGSVASSVPAGTAGLGLDMSGLAVDSLSGFAAVGAAF